MRIARLFVLAVLCLSFAAVVASAQAPVTTADLARLDTAAADIRAQVSTLRKTDPTLAGDVEQTLADLSDEITYLKVKLRREGSVPRADYVSLSDRLETLRIKAQGTQPAPGAAAPLPMADGGVAPVGTELDVRLQTTLNSATAKVEQRFEATTVADYSPNGSAVLIPAGSVVRGFVGSVRAANKIDRRGSLTLSFDEIRIGDRSQRLRASVTQALDPKTTDDKTRVGAGAIVGGLIGGILGGGKGALLGVLVGGGGTLAATEGTDVDLPPGTILRIRLDEALTVAPGR